MENMKDLLVECYDSKEVETKKQSLIKRTGTAGGAIVIALGLFNLTGCAPFIGNPPIIMGGAGSWFHSCSVDECECTDCECTEDECSPIDVGGAGTLDESESSE